MEFALLLPVFLSFMMGVLEIGLMMLHDVLLQNAAGVAARQLRTGVVQANADPEGAFRTLLCNQAEPIVDCSGVAYTVRTYPTYNDAATDTTEATGFAPGGARSIMVVRVSYEYDFFTPLIGQAMGGGTDNSRTLVSTVIVKGEPWD